MKFLLSLVLLLVIAESKTRYRYRYTRSYRSYYEYPTWGEFKKCKAKEETEYKSALKEYNQECGVNSELYKNTPECQYFNQELERSQRAEAKWSETTGEDFQICMDKCTDLIDWDKDASDLAYEILDCSAQLIKVSMVILASLIFLCF